jgi:hypothetical protein
MISEENLIIEARHRIELRGRKDAFDHLIRNGVNEDRAKEIISQLASEKKAPVFPGISKTGFFLLLFGLALGCHYIYLVQKTGTQPLRLLAWPIIFFCSGLFLIVKSIHDE